MSKKIVFKILFEFQWWYSRLFARVPRMLPIPITRLRIVLKRLFEWSRDPNPSPVGRHAETTALRT